MNFQNKGPRLTPKNLEWGTVEKMWITTGGELGPNDVPTDFRDTDNKLKEVQSILTELGKRVKNHQKSILASSQASQSLAGHLASLATCFNDVPLIGNAFFIFTFFC